TPEWPETRTTGTGSSVSAMADTLKSRPSILLAFCEPSHHSTSVPATVRSMFAGGTLNVRSTHVSPPSVDSYTVWQVSRFWIRSHLGLYAPRKMVAPLAAIAGYEIPASESMSRFVFFCTRPGSAGDFE